MRRSLFVRVLAIVLIVCLCVTPVSAAGWGNNKGNNGKGNGWGWGNSGWGNSGKNPGYNQPGQNQNTSELTVVEDSTTVENGEMLRAETYALTTGTGRATNTTTVKYFPVTMYDYDESTINAATKAKDTAGTTWEGIYFNNGSPNGTSETVTTSATAHADLTWAQVQNGTYYTTEDCTQKVTVTAITEGSSGYSAVSVTADEIWASAGGTALNTAYKSAYFYQMYGNYYPVYITNYGSYYYVSYLYSNGIHYSIDGGYWSSGQTLSVYKANSVTVGYTLTAGGQTLATLNSTDTRAKVGVTLYSKGATTTVTKNYAVWNRWSYGASGNSAQNKAYTGLVQDSLVNDQIVFNHPEGGIFNDDASVKSIYEYVGLPFVLNTETGVYSFDSDVNGVYFEGAPQSGTANNPYNLHFDQGNTQGWSGMYYGDGSSNLWAPFNTNSNDTGESSINYHFGMRADLPFSMTANGRVKSTDNSSTPITFSFKGDDDVWVFIDGNLVIDLGGIHNRLGATIDFAANTITYSKPDSNKSGAAIGSFNDESFALTQKLFTDAQGKGVIDMSREAFAALDQHEMQIFYLERGKGTSNCQIEFNLPMNDTVLVTKDATKSWNKETNTESNLTAAEQKIVDNMNFGFTLYKNGAVVPNTNFYLMDKDGKVLGINSTNANGHFTLKNGQTAKFITEIPNDGVTYQVVEDSVPEGFVSPDFAYAGEAVNGFICNGTNYGSANEIPTQEIALTEKVYSSYQVTAKGSIESNDSIHFICSNFMDATLPNPSVFSMEDTIVIDYGLPVQIDPLANDLYRGDTLEILYIGGADVKLTTTTGADGVVTATWTEDNTLDFGSVELVKGTADAADDSHDTLVYTLGKQLTDVEVLTYVARVTGSAENAAGTTVTQNAYALGKVYIIPATQMYYEENFTDLVNFTGSGWQGEVTTAGASNYQEPGVVGTVGDSVYGSDVAYLHDGYDSNGTSYYGKTNNGAIRFTYTFTGTGTSFFARTSATTGYMQVILCEGTTIDKNNPVNMTYRDTYYKDTNNTDEDAAGTLYNIPVYTQDGLDYGTYTVQVTIAKAGTKTGSANGAGNEFFLDGIRVMKPMDESSNKYERAENAYAADGEQNMALVTLRQKLLCDADEETGKLGENFVVMTDTDGAIVLAEDYANIGPKEEVYLMPGQSISFSIKHWHKDGYMLNLGMKAPFGDAVAQVGKTTYDLENTVDCYYDITSNYSSLTTVTENGETFFVATYTITAKDEIVALTNLKVAGEYQFELVEGTDIDVARS